MKKLILVILVLFLATGCAVYTPAPYYYGGAYPYHYSQYPYYGHYDYGYYGNRYYPNYGYRHYGY